MKKFLSMVMITMMTLSLVACGSVDATKATNTFNTTNASLTEVSTLANENSSFIDDETRDSLVKIANAFSGYKTELESKDLTQERADAILKEVETYASQISSLKTKVDELIAEGKKQQEENKPETDPEGLQAFLSSLSIIPTSNDYVGTGWEFAGGMLNGAEMSETDAEEFISAYGGTLQVVFDDAENVSMVQGSGTLSGIYRNSGDGITIQIVISNGGTDISYIGLFANVNDTTVLMLLPDGTGKNAIYFAPIEG